MATEWSDLALSVAVQALASLHDGGHRVLCAGPRPASTREGLGASVTILALVPYDRPAFAAPDADGVAVAAPSPIARATGTGRPTWFRCVMADGRSVIKDGGIPEDARLDRDTLLFGDEVRVLEERLESGR